MNVWETEDESAAAAQISLPRSSDTPYRTPSRNSRKSTRRKSKSPPAPSSSPPPRRYSNERNSQRNSKDVTSDESISILDPRRFTPTLHANLVSEILTLRRDQEDKIKFIENLEANLQSSRSEQENLAENLSTTAKEARSLKRQLALLEGGTSSALGELAHERDEAVEAAAETKKRLEMSQKKLRSQEEAAERLHEIWARDKDTWEEERRKYERKVHVAEGRLKAILDEVAAYQAQHHGQLLQNEAENDDVLPEGGVGHGSDAGSVRSMSMTNSVRFSMLGGPHGYGAPKFNGVSLADELGFEDEEDSPTENEGQENVMSTMHKRTYSRDSAMSRTHRRNQSIQSIESLRRPTSVSRGRHLPSQTVLDRLNGGIAEDDESSMREKSVYVDAGVQYTPPSPKTQPAGVPNIVVEDKQMKQPPGGDSEIEANQRRKRVHASPLIIEPGHLQEPTASAPSQILDGPLSPPRTPKSPTRAPPAPPIAITVKSEVVSVSTQTDFPGLTDFSPAASEAPISIPAISIHPPTSRPSTPKGPLLPQYVKDAGCQVNMQVSTKSRSASVQTEEIRVDKRINMLPRHLQPSAISSCPPSPEPESVDIDQFPPVPGTIPPRNPRRMKSQHTLVDVPSSPPAPIVQPTHDSYPGNNDDGPLARDKFGIRRPPRISSLFAGFDAVSSDDAEDFADADLSDSDFRTALSAPRPKSIASRLGKRTSGAPTSVPEDVEPSDEDRRQKDKQAAKDDATNTNIRADPTVAQLVPIKSGARLFDKPLGSTGTIKQGAMRRTTLISNGITAHQSRARSPSLPEAINEPPFPIPTRASSRKVPFSASAPSDGTRSPTRGAGGDALMHKRRGSGRAHYRVNSIRKVKSGTSLAGNGQRHRRHASRSPPPFSASTEAPESPQLPPMPTNEVTSPFRPSDVHGPSRYTSHRQQLSTNTANTSNTGSQSVNSAGQATSVVDAIAQTMVGEWMHKYVRRRKSFGVSESATFDTDAANGVRHKRWVWLAPYERAVMWSSKQPTSGTALLGKSGRKLTIQSVLDVKDDNPPPKGAGPLFNRSILILTPARALKFTTTTSDRHYIWLTALSFLAHSTQAVPELISPTPPPVAPAQIQFENTQNQILEFDMMNGPTRLRKNPIRDSIRVTKSKGSTVALKSGPPSEQGSESIRTDTSTRHAQSQRGGPSNAGSMYTETLPDAASPPNVPRFLERSYPGSHGRKRSNTGSRIPPPLSFRGFTERGPASSVSGTSDGRGTFVSSNGTGHAPTSSIAGLSTGTNGSSDIYNPSVSANSYSQRSSNYGVGGGGPVSGSGISSIRTSDASSRPGHVVNNFFDAVGTVRMEAFISPLATHNHVAEQDFDPWPQGHGAMRKRRSREFTAGVGRRRSREAMRGQDGRRRRGRNQESLELKGNFMDDWYGGSKTAGEEEYGTRGRERVDDPFRGF